MNTPLHEENIRKLKRTQNRGQKVRLYCVLGWLLFFVIVLIASSTEYMEHKMRALDARMERRIK